MYPSSKDLPVHAVVGLLLVAAACDRPPETSSDADPVAAPGAAPVTTAGRVLSASATDEDGILRILIYHDMEGLAGQDDPMSFEFGKEAYDAYGRELLTADVNAVIAGLFDGGADEVHVVDGHGSGNPDPDLLLEKLDPRAVMTFRDEPFDAYGDLPEPGVFDAVAVVGMHAKTGSGGFASHTFTLGMDIIMNGMSITETELIGFSWGRVGVPVIFASGDDRLANDLTTMPWIEYVTVKRATSASTAELRPVDEARADLWTGAQRAVENLAEARVTVLMTPVTAALRAVAPARLDHLEGVPGIDYSDGTVTFEAEDFQAAYDGVSALIGVATRGYVRLLNEVFRERPDGGEIAQAYSDLLFERWMDVESGRWTAPEPAAPEERRRYFGYR